MRRATFEPCTRVEDVQVISCPYRRARASRPAAGYAASAFGGSEDGRTSLYGDGLVRLWMDGSAARGASPCSPTVSRNARHRSPVQSDRADPGPPAQAGKEGVAPSRKEGEKGSQEGREESRQEAP